MSGTWHHDMPQHSTEPTTHQALAPSAPILFSRKSMFVTDPFIFSASAKAWRQRQIKAGILFVGSTVKTWSLKSWEHETFNSDMWISLIQNLANNSESDRCLQHLHIWQFSLNRDEWWNYSTSKPSKLVTVKAFNRAHHTPGLGALVANVGRSQIDVRNGRVCLQCLGQGLEAATDQGWHLVRGLYRQNLITEILRTRDI